MARAEVLRGAPCRTPRLAGALTLQFQYGYADPEPTLGQAEAAARRALELDPELAEAHGAFMLLHDTRRDGPAIIRTLQRALDLRPGYADAHDWLSWEYALLGRRESALEYALRAVQLHPLSPEAVSNLSLARLINGDSEGAIEEARKQRRLEPRFDTGPFYEALALFELGRYTESIRTLANLDVAWAGAGAPTTVALAHAADGDAEHARAAMDRPL